MGEVDTTAIAFNVDKWMDAGLGGIVALGTNGESGLLDELTLLTYPLVLGDGKIFYHLTYIDDLVEGFRLCGEAPGAAGRTYILAGAEVPTLNEQGLSGFDDLTWTGFFVPAGMPQDLVNRLNSEISRALLAPDVTERLAQLGLAWKTNTSGEFAEFLRNEIEKWSKAVKESGAKAD